MYHFGPDALLDTRSSCSQGIAVTGAGRDLDEAREPAIVERDGIKVGFLGYRSVIPKGGEAHRARSASRRCASRPYTKAAGPTAALSSRGPDEGDMR